MGTIMDYLEWRGDLSFSQDPFNDVDALVFAMLSYLPFNEIVPGIDTNDSISFWAAADGYFEKYPKQKEQNKPEPNMTASSSMDAELLKLLKNGSQSARFADVHLSRYEEKTDYSAGEQFAALTFNLPVRFRPKVVAFRGTDNTLIGWKEDFAMAYMDHIPAQESARRYLDRVGGIFSGRVAVCGHSKGGNLAVYAASRVNFFGNLGLTKVINFDGPGFNFSILPRDSFSRCEEKIVNYVPEESVVGLLLEPVGEQKVIKSSALSIYQHNPVSWEIQRTGFVPGNLSDSAKWLETTLENWLAQLSLQKRKATIDALFDVLGASQGKTLNPKEGLKELNAIIKNFGNLDEETKDILSDVLLSITKQAGNAIKETLTAKLSKDN